MILRFQRFPWGEPTRPSKIKDVEYVDTLFTWANIQGDGDYDRNDDACERGFGREGGVVGVFLFVSP